MTEAEVELGAAGPERPQVTPEANRKAWDGLPLAFGGSIICHHLCLRLLDPREGKQHISVVVSHPGSVLSAGPKEKTSLSSWNSHLVGERDIPPNTCLIRAVKCAIVRSGGSHESVGKAG